MTADITGETASRPVCTFADRHYALVLREGASRFYWKLDNEGVTISGDLLRWEHDGVPRERHFSEIASVHLQVGHVHKSGDVGTCQIMFRDSLILTLQSSDARGFADDGRARDYVAFVHDLHARLTALGPKDIRYKAGHSENRHLFGMAVLAIAGLFFVGLPLALFIYARSWEVFGILGAGVAFVWPVARVLQRNSPRDYSPSRVPDDLLP